MENVEIIPAVNHHYENGQLWVYGLGQLRKTEAEARKEKEPGAREYMCTYNFYGQTWYKLQSRYIINTCKF